LANDQWDEPRDLVEEARNLLFNIRSHAEQIEGSVSDLHSALEEASHRKTAILNTLKAIKNLVAVLTGAAVVAAVVLIGVELLSSNGQG
jgi:hypothetical protein